MREDFVKGVQEKEVRFCFVVLVLELRYNQFRKIKRGGVPMDKQMVDELVAGLLKIVDEQLVSVILYGSVARGTASSESDVDVALLVKGSLSSETEDALSDFIVDMNLKYDKVFSVIDIDIDNYEKWKAVTPFYKNVKQDGIVLWKVA